MAKKMKEAVRKALKAVVDTRNQVVQIFPHLADMLAADDGENRTEIQELIKGFEKAKDELTIPWGRLSDFQEKIDDKKGDE